MATNPMTMRTTTPKMTYHHFETKPDMESIRRVGKGSFAPSEVKNTLKRGNTNAARTTTVTTDIAKTIPG